MSAASDEFERIVRAIFQRLREQFGFERVEGSRKYKGKSTGRKRQIDATAIKPDGTMSPIECKLHKRKIGIEALDKFNSITHDELEADEGIIVSSSGFDAGAEAAGSGYNLKLATLNKDATEHNFILRIGKLLFGGVSRSIVCRFNLVEAEPNNEDTQAQP